MTEDLTDDSNRPTSDTAANVELRRYLRAFVTPLLPIAAIGVALILTV